MTYASMSRSGKKFTKYFVADFLSIVSGNYSKRLFPGREISRSDFIITDPGGIFFRLGFPPACAARKNLKLPVPAHETWRGFIVGGMNFLPLNPRNPEVTIPKNTGTGLE